MSPRGYRSMRISSRQTPDQSRQAAQKGPDARRRPKVAREAYFLYVERAIEGANEADGPFSAACARGGGGATLGSARWPTNSGRCSSWWRRERRPPRAEPPPSAPRSG